jgi:putative DNA primase/helicase
MDISAQDVLNSLFNADEKVCLRVFEDRKEGIFPGAKYTVECGKAAGLEDTLRNHNALNRGIFYTVNYGGHNDADIVRVNAQFVEMDKADLEEQQKRIDAFPLPPSMIIRTRKSLHTYWFVKDGDVSRFRSIQKQLVRHFDGDPMCVNESRVMRLPGYLHCKQEPVMVRCILFHPERRYTQQEISDALPPAEDEPVVRKKGSGKGLDIVLHECDFLRHCKENAATLPEHDWYAMITNLASFEGGTEMIHRLSSPYPGYSEAETQKKINHFLESGTRPITCRVIAEKGYQCPRLKDGGCSCRSPAALCYAPMSVDGLRSVIAELPITGDDLKDLKTATDFVQRYLYNQDAAIAEGIINYELKNRYRLKANIVRSLSGEYRTVNRKYQAEQKNHAQSVDETLPLWYEPIEGGGLRFLPGVLADHLAEEQQVFYAAEQYYRYEGGVYREMNELEAQKITRDKMLSRECRMSQIADAEKQWRLNIQRGIHELNANPYMINLKNGLYNVLEDRLIPHTPEFCSTVQLNVSYNPEAKCPRFRQYLEEVLDADQIPLIQEMMGYFLVPVTRAQKCFVIVGEGGAGKSQLLLVLNELLLGKENVSNVSWQSLNERFKTAALFGKLANIFADLPTKNIDDNGIFKALVGEDYLTVEKKNKNPFSFQSTARLLFSCNSIPRNYGDRSEGFYRRLIIIRFDHPVPEDRKDPDLLDKLRQEADGIFLFALEGLKRLMANHYQFSETEANRAELQQYREDSDSGLSFIKDCCEVGDNYACGSMELFDAYRKYCEENGLRPYALKKLVQQVLAVCPGAEKGVDSTGRRRIIRHVRFTPWS